MLISKENVQPGKGDQECQGKGVLLFSLMVVRVSLIGKVMKMREDF